MLLEHFIEMFHSQLFVPKNDALRVTYFAARRCDAELFL